MITRRGFILAGLSVAARAQNTEFDDADFSGWESVGSGSWNAEGAELVGRSDKNRPGAGYIFTRNVYTDFRMTLLFNISAGGRSGVFVREPHRKWTTEGDSRPGRGPTGGFEVLIDYHDRDNPTGTIDNLQKSKRLVGAEAAWNELEIVCKGSEIRISVAGQNVNRCNQLRVQPGVIGFEVPAAAAQNFVVRYRDIVIRTVA